MAGKDNFSDEVNPIYFAVLYVLGFVLGRITPAEPFRMGGILLLSQLVSYVIYPNIHWELGNLFPITAILLLVLDAPALLATYVGFSMRGRRQKRLGRG